MAKTKKRKSSTKAKRAANANKARQALIKKEIAKHEADKKRAKNLKKARKALAQKEVAKAERKNKKKIAQARYAANAANRRAYAAERKAEAKKAENYRLHKELAKRKNPAGARAQGFAQLWLAIGSLVFAILYLVLYVLVNGDNPVITEAASVNAAQISYVVFWLLMNATIVGQLALVSPLWGTLKKEKHLKRPAAASLILIWIFCAFAFIIFILNMLLSVNNKVTSIPLVDIDQTADYVISLIAVFSPVVLVIFSGILYGSICNHYPKYIKVQE